MNSEPGTRVGEPIKIAIVDDIAETRDHLVKLLSFESDMEVVGSIASGEELLGMINNQQVDVVLLDINMPGGPARFTLATAEPAERVGVGRSHPKLDDKSAPRAR